MKYDIIDFDSCKAESFLESLDNFHIFDFIECARLEISSVQNRINDMLNKAYSLRSNASDAIRHETEKLSQINEEIKGKTAVRNSIPPVLWINMQEKDKYGNPIKRPVDNSFEIDSYNNILKNLENKKEQIEKQLYKYEFIREKSESWIEKYRDISIKISNLPGLDSIRSMLEVQLKDIRTAVKDAIYFAQMIMKSSIGVNSMKNKGDSYLYLDNYKLENYKNFLNSQKNQIIANDTALREMFVHLSWDDNIYENIKNEILNKHFESVNYLVSVIQQVIEDIDEILTLAQKYLNIS